MTSLIRSTALAAAIMLLAPLAGWPQGSGKPRPRSRPASWSARRRRGFTLKDQEGKIRSLDELLKKGKVAPGILPIGRLVTVLPHATGPVAT